MILMFMLVCFDSHLFLWSSSSSFYLCLLDLGYFEGICRCPFLFCLHDIHPPCYSDLCISLLLICCLQDPFALMVFIIILSFVAYKTSTLLWWSSYSSSFSLPTKPLVIMILVFILFFITYMTYALFQWYLSLSYSSLSTHDLLVSMV